MGKLSCLLGAVLRYQFAAFVLVLVLILTLTQICDTVTPRDKCYTEAAVASDAENCSEIGRDMLKRNGSVVDAAIAALLCVSVVHPHSMGIGGGVVFTIYNASAEKVETINARETAPKNASKNMFGNDPKKNPDGLFIAVPGELRGYELAHNRSGKLPWKELFKPSIKLAREGFKIGKALAKTIQNYNDRIMNNTTLCEVFCDSNKNPLKENDTIRFPKLADTYEKIAEEGADAFYDGSLTDDILKDIEAAGGIITREDLKGYQPVPNERPLNFTVGNYTFHAPDAPFGGPALALILNILKGNYTLSNSNVSTIRNKTLTYHRMIEAFRFADVQRNKLGDPLDENITESVLQIVKNMTSVSFAEEIRRKIKDDIKQERYGEQCYDNCQVDDSGTSHLSIIGEDGSAVAVTSSINNYFGSKVRSNSTGIIFNDQMNDFCKPKLENVTDNNCYKNNLIKPGKRPLSSMCPTIILVKDSKMVKMVVGAEGGTNITTATAQVILNYLFFGYDLQKAVKEPRIQIAINETNVEDCFDVNVTDGLREKNHRICHNTETTVVQAVVRDGDEVCAESDPRKYGYSARCPEPGPCNLVGTRDCSMIIIISVCVFLPLIGVFTLAVWKLRPKTRGDVHSQLPTIPSDGLLYAAVSFQEHEASLSDATVRLINESHPDYSAVGHSMTLN